MKHYNSRLSLVCLGAMVSVSALAADIKYTGTVLDSSDEPLIGATIKVPGTNILAITDLDGNFTINVPEGKKVEISYVGFSPMTITDFNQHTIVLKEDTETLDEVVVVGYGTQKKAHLTGSIATVNMDDVSDLANGDLASSLSGMVNGLGVNDGSSRPGERATLSIRGSESNLKGIGSNSQEPLFVIDGFIYPNDVRTGHTQSNAGAEAFNNLDPSQIESISVLKDAAAAVYGSRAANGVILVTTKKGKMGEPVITYSGSVGITDAVSRPKMLDAYQYGLLWNAVKMGDPKSTTVNPLKDLFQADELAAMRNLNYDLLDDHWKTGFTQKHSVGVSGATEKANYYANISYFDEEGNLGHLDYDRWNYRAGVDVTLKKWVKASLQVSGDYGKKEQPLVKVGGSASDDYNLLLSHPRYIPEYVNGYPIATIGPSNELIDGKQNYHFPVLDNSGDFSKDATSNLNINASLEYDFGWSEILKGLRIRFSYGKSISNTKNNQYGSEYNMYYMSERAGSGKHLYTPIPGQEEAWDALMYDSNFMLSGGTPTYNGGKESFVSRTMTRADNYQMNLTASYNRTFGDHTVGALFSIEKSEFESEYLFGSVSSPYEFGGLQSNAANGSGTTSFFRSEAGTLSYIGRVNYAYKDKYLLEFLLRSDSSTKFAPENYWGTFPSVSVGWVISQEDWFRNNVNWVDFLKIRASYGITGRDNTEYWTWKQTYNADKDKGPIFGMSSNINAGSMITLTDANQDVNRDVHWDKSHKANVGIDFNVLRSRLAFNIDAYHNWDREMLLPYKASIPGTVGAVSAKTNIGKMNSWGVEFSATWRDRIGKDFSYKATLNTGYSDNKLLLKDWETEYTYRQQRAGYRSDIGVWGMECIGMFRSYQDIDEYFAKYGITKYLNMTKDEVKPGMLIYKDVRGALQPDGTYAGPDGIVDKENDQVQLSHRSNPYHVTLNLNATYKAFSLTAQLTATWGGYSFINNDALSPKYDLEFTNMPSFWDPYNMYVYDDIYDAAGNLLLAQNRDAELPNLAHASVNSMTSNFWRVSGTRVTMPRLTLAYTLPAKLVNKIGISSCRVNVTGQNLVSFYNPYPDNFIDPMTGDYGKYPKLRKFTFGLNLSF